MNQVEEFIIGAVLWLRLIVETIGAIVVAVGIFASVWMILRSLLGGQKTTFTQIRLTLARYLALGLEFQLGADILSTAVSPSWDQLGKLGAIAVIRTALNYFLTREMREENRQVKHEKALDP